MKRSFSWSLALLGLTPLALVRGAAAQGALPPTEPSSARVRFAAIGDYGTNSVAEADVASLVKRWDPLFVITLGDNNYPNGAAATIDANIGQHYRKFIHPYLGSYGPGASTQRFFPSLGNHDWVTAGALPYLNYFDLPGNERYYDFVRGPVHFFVLDSDDHEPDGVGASSVQAQWLESALGASSSPFKLVYFHHPPYSSAQHGPTPALQWPFAAWGASAVLAGHDHSYERFGVGGRAFFVNGLGGASLYAFGAPLVGSELRFASDYGAMLVDATSTAAKFQFVARDGNVIDTCTLSPGGFTGERTSFVARGATWKYLDDGSDQGTLWRLRGFDDSTWAAGPAELGYGDGDEATVVSFGPNASAKYITTYFRTQFVVANPLLFERLELELLRDDGALVWLNGVELARSNLPAGSVTSATVASSAVSDDDELRFYYLEPGAGPLVSGTNTLAVELHQSGPTSTDVSFDLSLSGVQAGSELVPSGAVWRYRDDGVDPGPSWTSLAYDDSGWASGPAELGYGDGGEATVVGYGFDPTNKHPTTWFRHEFVLADASLVKALKLELERDDGAVVYVNGHEAARFNLRSGAVASSEHAPLDVSGAAEAAFIETWLDPRLLKSGSNVIAVELHQSSPSSRDLSFDLALTAY